ncbi:hypothetical protein MHYP_G00250900 [Metynnis hypsauchen]
MIPESTVLPSQRCSRALPPAHSDPPRRYPLKSSTRSAHTSLLLLRDTAGPVINDEERMMFLIALHPIRAQKEVSRLVIAPGSSPRPQRPTPTVSGAPQRPQRLRSGEENYIAEAPRLPAETRCARRKTTARADAGTRVISAA